MCRPVHRAPGPPARTRDTHGPDRERRARVSREATRGARAPPPPGDRSDDDSARPRSYVGPRGPMDDVDRRIAGAGDPAGLVSSPPATEAAARGAARGHRRRHPSRPAPGVRRAGPARGGRPRRDEPGPGAARRRRRRQERAAALLLRPGRRLARDLPPWASSRRWSSPTAGCTSSARPCSSASSACPLRSGRARGGVRPERRAAAGPVPGRARRPDPAGRGRRAAAAGLPGRRRAVARPGDSAQVLGFVARRLLAERVAIVCAARPAPTGRTRWPACPSCAVTGLRNGDARALLLSTCTARWMPTSSTRIVAESQGNPLALLELPRTWSAADLAGGLRAAGPATGRGQDRAAATSRASLRCRGETRSSWCSPRPPSRWATRCCSAVPPRRSGSTWPPSSRRRTPGCSQVGDGWSSPTRSSARRSTGPPPTDDRHRVHSALAEATDAETDPDRRAWHLARATAGPRREVAAELERSAGRAQARGGVAAAAAFLGRATQLTPDPATRVRRALDAASANVQAGAFDDARGGCSPWPRHGPVDEMQRARIDLLRAQLALCRAGATRRRRCCSAAARRLEPLDVELARRDLPGRVLRGAVRGAAQRGRRRPRGGRGGASRRTAPPTRSPRPPTCCWTRSCALPTDYEGARATCRAALDALAERRDSLPDERLRWLWQGASSALEVWDDERRHPVARHMSRSRARRAR